MATAEGIGELLAAAPKLPFQPTKNHVSRAIQRCIDYYADGILRRFTRFLGVPTTTVNYWRMYGKHPKLGTLSALINVCYKLQLPILSILTDTIEFDSKKKGLASACPIKKTRLDNNYIENKLKAALHRNPPPSVGSLIKELHHYSLQYSFPRLCEQITERYKRYKKSLKEERYALLLEASKEYPPPPLTKVVSRSKFEQTTFRIDFPALCKKITRRYLSHRKNELNKRRQRVLHEVRRVAIELRRRDVYPSVESVKKHMAIEDKVSIKDMLNIVYKVQRELRLK